MSPDSPVNGLFWLLADPLLLVDTAVTGIRDVATPLPALFVMLASNPVLDIVTVAGAFVIVAVIAVPLELIVMIVWLALSVWMAISVVSVPVPTTVDSPTVSDIIADPRVIVLPTAILSCGEVVWTAPGVVCLITSSKPLTELPAPTLAVPVAAAADP